MPRLGTGTTSANSLAKVLAGPRWHELGQWKGGNPLLPQSSAGFAGIPILPEGVCVQTLIWYHHPQSCPHKLGLPSSLLKRLSQRLRLSTALPRKAHAESWRSIGQPVVADCEAIQGKVFYARR